MWRSQAEAEGLTLLVADNKTGNFGVHHQRGKNKPYEARVRRGGKQVHLGYFATAEQAALCVARSPEGQEAARRAAASEGGQGTGRAMPPGAVLKEEGVVALWWSQKIYCTYTMFSHFRETHDKRCTFQISIIVLVGVFSTDINNQSDSKSRTVRKAVAAVRLRLRR